jgi:hypothetical protein
MMCHSMLVKEVRKSNRTFGFVFAHGAEFVCYVLCISLSEQTDFYLLVLERIKLTLSQTYFVALMHCIVHVVQCRI